MRRWRWDLPDENRKREPVQWPITSEREVQDVLYLILRSVFDDVVDEETLPKFGHASTRADFGIPSLRVLVEAKYAYNGSDYKKIEQELMVDSVAYPQKNDLYSEIVAFISDASAAVEHHDVTRRALLEIPVISDVVIVSRPAALAVAVPTKPAATRKPASTGWRQESDRRRQEPERKAAAGLNPGATPPGVCGSELAQPSDAAKRSARLRAIRRALLASRNDCRRRAPRTVDTRRFRSI